MLYIVDIILELGALRSNMDKIYFQIFRATGLTAKDTGGTSDAFCKVKVNDEKLFKTQVKLH